jgi:hypothetical protein
LFFLDNIEMEEEDFLSFIIHQVTKTIPKIGNAEINTYGNIANKVDGSNKVIDYFRY